jgi:lipoyl-dependent peroxiredoxin
MQVMYTTSVKVSGGGAGRARSNDGALDIGLVTPSELGGSRAPGANPEPLFAAGYPACSSPPAPSAGDAKKSRSLAPRSRRR